MALERLYTIPLRKEFMKAPIYRRTKKAVKALKQFISRHMKVPVEKVKVCKHLNEFLWQNGPKNPPCRVKVKTRKIEDIAQVELPEYEFEKTKAELEAEKKAKKPEAKEAKVETKPETEEKIEEKAKEEKASQELEEKIAKEGKAPEVEKSEAITPPEEAPPKKEALQTKEVQEKIESEKRIPRTQKKFFKHKKPKKA